MAEHRIFTALVTFERMDLENEILPPEVQGACGYMAIAANDEEDVLISLREELSHVALRLLDVEQIEQTTLDSFPDDLDDHLAENVRQWEAGKRTVWGTIHEYFADGEA